MKNKAIMSIILSTAFLQPILPYYKAYAVEESLMELAESLGSDTDYFKFPNYATDVSSDVFGRIFKNYTERCNPHEILRAEDEVSVTIGFGHCAGIAALETLVHNGVISASDIQANAENLSDIFFDEKVDEIISHYQLLQAYSPLDLYIHWYVSNYNKSEQILKLIETAEKSMKENKYFVISLFSSKMSHAVTGMGIADGSWTFKGKTYDKCILVKDSNLIVSKDNPEAAGFSEKRCIYINSGTYDSYIPMYNDESVDETFSYTPIDSDTLLNYKGLLKPSESYDVDLTGINKIETTAYGGFEMIVTDLEGNEYDGLDREVIFGGNWLSKITFHKAKRYQINSFGNSETFDTEIKGEACLFRVNLVTEDKSPISLDYSSKKKCDV